MHYYHAHILSADDSSDAESQIQSKLEPYEDRLYDYFSIFEADRLPTEYDNEYKQLYDYCKTNKLGDKVVVPLNSDTLDFLKKIIFTKIDHTKDSLNNYREKFIQQMAEKGLSSFDEITLPNPEDYGSMFGYYLKQFGEIVSGDLHADSFFYDWEKECSNTTEKILDEYVEKGGHYVVFIDFHY